MRALYFINNSKKGYCFSLLFLLFFLTSAFPSQEEEIPVLLIEPSFLHQTIYCPISGAQRTVIVPGLLKKDSLTGEIASIVTPGWKSIDKKRMTSFVRIARKNLSLKLSSLTPKFLRDDHHVIQVAILDSSSPITASTILSVDFATYFAKIFGPELFLAIPSANRVYIFSKLASPINNIAPAIRDDYKLSTVPISTELFELSKGKLRVVGSLE